ncbi:MAG: hypothetical protein Q8Q05_02065 [bacterium]|nr:hypothetical protein [bacterium]
MFDPPDIIRILVGAILFWIGVYLVSRNIKSQLAWVLFIFLFSLSWYIVFVDVITPLYANDLGTSILLYQLTNWTYILPIPIVLHLSTLTTKRGALAVNKISLRLIYLVAVILLLLATFTNLVTDNSNILSHSSVYGYFMGRGPLFPIIAVITAWASILAAWNYLSALKANPTLINKYKFGLATAGAVAYAIIGPFLVYIYYSTSLYDFAVSSTAPLLIAPVVLWIVSIFFFRLVSDIEDLFNLKEFVYLSLAILLICSLNAFVYSQFAYLLGKLSLVYTAIFLYVTIFTHNFYDWLTTFIRDLLYNAGKGFSLITDADVNDLVRNFHTPEKIEASSIVRFKSVKHRAKNGQLVDAAQQLVRDSIEYFKQSDFPRRNKQNLKYQILKMTTVDGSEEGQILWELGFDGYPMKIMTGEDSTRKPLFKIESMSDYTATSRNAFIALKKEAIHDLAWRLSYLERNSK